MHNKALDDEDIDFNVTDNNTLRKTRTLDTTKESCKNLSFISLIRFIKYKGSPDLIITQNKSKRKKTCASFRMAKHTKLLGKDNKIFA